MKILILNGSHRKNGNCYSFCDIAKKILLKKHKVIQYNLIEMNINRCSGCLLCEDGIECPIKDDYSGKIIKDIFEADLIIVATPTYFNMPSAEIVNLLDRTNNLYKYFYENSKKVMTYISGQTDIESINDTYRCLKTYFEIMKMNEIEKPLFHVARLREEIPQDFIEIIEKI